MEAETSKYSLIMGDKGIIDVFAKEPPQVNVSYFGNNPNEAKRMQADLQQIVATSRRTTPIFRAANNDGTTFIIDMEAGVQRFNGPKPARLVAKYLRTLGFETKLVTKIMKEAKQHTHQYVGQFW